MAIWIKEHLDDYFINWNLMEKLRDTEIEKAQLFYRISF
jgi:hypothetical protein